MIAELVERSQRALSDAARSGLCSEASTIIPRKKEMYIVYIGYINRPFARDS